MESVENPNTLNDSNAVGLLVIGKSGVGKTTLINAFTNFFHKKKYMDERLILIPQKSEHVCSFPVYADKCNMREKDKDVKKRGESLTDQVTKYELQAQGRTLIIIDTPGFGDTRGFEKDKENVKLIIDRVKECSFIQAMLIVVDSSARKDSYFQHIMSEIKKILTKPCAEQCLVVCTKNPAEFPPEVKTMLEETLGFLPSDDKLFAIDNKCLFGEAEDDEDRALFEEEWEKASIAFENIYTKASQFPKIVTQDLAQLFENRQQIEKEVKNLIGEIHDYKQLMERKLTREESEAFLKNPESFISPEKRKIKSASSNYNCEECNTTCIQDTSRVGYIMGTIVTLSIYHWVSESQTCDYCPHQNRSHCFEKYYRSKGINVLELQALKEKAEKIIQKEGSERITDAIISECNKRVQEKVQRVAELSAQIDNLGVVSVNYDSYINYLEDNIYLLGKDESLDPKTKEEKKLALQKEKAEYLDMKLALKQDNSKHP